MQTKYIRIHTKCTPAYIFFVAFCICRTFPSPLLNLLELYSVNKWSDRYRRRIPTFKAARHWESRALPEAARPAKC